MYLKENLAYLRKKNSISQMELGDKLGVTKQAVSNWETGHTNGMPLETLINLASIFSVSIDDLLTKDLRPAGIPLSKNLKYLRKKERYTQAEMSAILKVKRSTLAGYEVGEKRPSYEGLLNLSEFFGVTVDDLLKKDLSKGEES